MNKKLYIVLILILTIAFSTKALATLTLGTTSVTSNGALTLTTNSSTLVLPTTNGTNGQVLTTNGSGVTSWTTVAGGGVTNSAGSNVVPKSDGVNLVPSRISDDGTDIHTSLSTGFFSLDTTTDSRLMLDSNAGSYLGTRGQLDADQVSLGDIDGALSETAIKLVSNTQTIDIIGPTAINLDSRGGVTTIGDLNGGNTNSTISLGSDGVISLISSGDGVQYTGGAFSPNSPGFVTLGNTAIPFPSLFIGNALNNSSQLTGTFTGNRVATLPDRSGTIKVGVDYKVYTALLTQTGTSAPVATVLENTLGGTLVWTRDSAGAYIGTLPGAFDAAKTFLVVGDDNGNIGNAVVTRLFRNDGDTVFLNTVNSIGGGTDEFFGVSVEIRVYP